MTLLITVFAAVAATLVWYTRKHDTLHLGALCFMLWGAGLMWLGDAVFGYLEDGADYFTPSAAEMLNDSFLGLSVVALALVAWMVIVLVRDSRGRVRRAVLKK
jgi:hypothetical protein